jgi:hypothetical protein
MRKHLFWVLGLALAVGVTGIAVAGGAQTHTIEAKVAPARQDDNRYGPASLDFTTASDCTGQGCRLNAANKVEVFVDDDLKLTDTGLPTCPTSRLQGTTTTQARSMCASSLVGKGTSVAYVGGTAAGRVTGSNTIFNGPDQGGRDTLTIHNYIQAAGSTVVLKGIVKPASGDFGIELEVSVPTLPFNTALQSFQNKLQRSFRFRGNRKHFITARCHDNNRTWNFRGRDTYGGGTPPETANATQRCTVRR